MAVITKWSSSQFAELPAGLQHHDRGEETVETSATMGGTRLRAYRDQFTWDCGLVVRDY